MNCFGCLVEGLIGQSDLGGEKDAQSCWMRFLALDFSHDIVSLLCGHGEVVSLAASLANTSALSLSSIPQCEGVQRPWIVYPFC